MSFINAGKSCKGPYANRDLTMRQLISPDALAPAMFVLVFPVFFGYQSLAAFGIIPPAIGGGLTLFCLAAAVLLAPFLMLRVRALWSSVAWLAALSLIVLVYAGYHRLFGLDYQQSMEVTLSSLKLVAAWAGLFAIGVLLKPSDGFRRVLFWCVIAMAIATPFLIKTPALSLIDTVRSGWGVASYQFFAGAFAFTAMLAIAYSWGRKSEPWLVALALVTIFFLLSRSEQAGMLAVAIGWAILKIVHREFRPILIASVGTAVLLGASVLLAPHVPSLMGSYRPVEIQQGKSVGSADVLARQAELLNLGGSDSWGERAKFMSGGIDDILRSPIVGDYAGQVRDFGFFGAYIHNGLSAWRQYGIVAFLLYMGMAITAFAVSAWAVLARKDTTPEWLSTAMIAGFSLLLVVFAKSIYWPMPALAWGIAASTFLASKSVDQRSARHTMKAQTKPTTTDATISATMT